ncbi:hypothetical protein F0562_003918 [Nyssa sinensis]|uniref:Uncharacterized protein n=1 Tax=Nyssa sinensis TaxID=561372 RepID=A0A5J5BX19_9ASTE|nr:hypothetical protein F0562_003918 [Nyssa sinensis]
MVCRLAAATRSEIDVVTGVDVEAGFDDVAVGYDRRVGSMKQQRVEVYFSSVGRSMQRVRIGRMNRFQVGFIVGWTALGDRAIA